MDILVTSPPNLLLLGGVGGQAHQPGQVLPLGSGGVGLYPPYVTQTGRGDHLEEMVNKVRGHMQYLGRVEVFTVDSGKMEIVKPSDLSALPDNLSGKVFPL